MAKIKDLTGNVFTRLTVIRRVNDYITPKGKKQPSWECYCDCGSIVTVTGGRLKSGSTKSCGCLAKHLHTKSGMSGTRPYRIWTSMKGRCKNSKSKRYEHYGGRGITYDPKWETFEGFWEDMGEGYKDGLTIERVDVNGNYCKDNCVWISLTLQNRNQRKSKNNTSGVTGVSLHKEKGTPKSYLSIWTDLQGKGRSKSFSLEKYGEELAFFAACEYRELMIMKLNLLGAGYADGHGK